MNVVLTRDVPDLDRWNYPFNETPGVSETMVSFSAIGAPILDNHDAQSLLGFETDTASPDGAGVIESGLGAARYDVVSLRLTLTIAEGDVFVADSTFDPWTSYLFPGDPERTPDADAGRPIMLFGTGYRNGYGVEEGDTPYEETSPYEPAPMGPQPRVRNAFASDYVNGVPRDISNNVVDRFEIFPFAIGQLADSGGPIAEGASVPAETTVTFDVDLSNEDASAFIRKGLDAGNLQLSVTSLHFAEGGPGGGGGVTYPVYFTKEDALALFLGQTATLELEVNILPENPADLNGDGVVDSFDLAILLAAWGACPGCDADFDGDGGVGPSDLAVVLAAWG